jgi:hypothetical protein
MMAIMPGAAQAATGMVRLGWRASSASTGACSNPTKTNRGYDSQDEINSIVERFARLAAVIRDANPADNAEIYKGTQPGADLPA